MPAPNRAEILRRAREAFLEHGRGFLDEFKGSLADEAEATTILMATEEAVNFYDPKSEAVVIDERAEGIFVLIVGAAETRVIGEFFWSKPT